MRVLPAGDGGVLAFRLCFLLVRGFLCASIEMAIAAPDCDRAFGFLFSGLEWDW
jgi:hypothetical protein